MKQKKIFNLPYKKISIITHPKSYIHSIIKFENGLIKLIAHDTDMKIPIFNSLFLDNQKKILKTKNIDLKKLNDLNFKKIDRKKFPSTKILKMIPENDSLFETIIISANDELVRLFLDKKIEFNTIQKNLIKFLSKNEFAKYKTIQPKNIKEIIKLNEYVRLKINSKSI